MLSHAAMPIRVSIHPCLQPCSRSLPRRSWTQHVQNRQKASTGCALLCELTCHGSVCSAPTWPDQQRSFLQQRTPMRRLSLRCRVCKPALCGDKMDIKTRTAGARLVYCALMLVLPLLQNQLNMRSDR